MNFLKSSTTFLKIIILLIGIAILVLCTYWLPRQAIKEPKLHPGVYSLYPLLIYLYGCCITFFVALYHALKLLNNIERNNAFSELSHNSLNTIKKCGMIIIAFLVLMIVTLKIISHFTGDDPAGPISLSLMSILASITVIAIVDVLEKLLKNILDANDNKN